MKTLKERIAVETAFSDGKDVEISTMSGKWFGLVVPFRDAHIFLWNDHDYRVKPEPLDMEKEIKELKEKLERVYEAGCWGISHVAMANYASRELEAANKIEDAMYGEEI